MPNKSYHETLGIRPNAGRDEIEMAYKGRRSQYHPDRYAQADAETQAWATACMQDVNQAYTALIAGGASNGHEREADTSRAAPVSTAPAITPMIDFKTALQAHRICKMALSRVYLAPNIPLKKLYNALESYGHGLGKDDVLALIDDTMLSSGKDGLLLTAHEIRTKQAFNPEQVFRLRDIALAWRKDSLYVHGKKVHRFNMTEAHEIEVFVQAVIAASEQAINGVNDTRGVTNVEQPRSGHQLEALLVELNAWLDNAHRQANKNTRSGRRGANMFMLLSNAIELTGKLPDAVKRVQGSNPTNESLAWLTCDAVRLELLAYQLGWISNRLHERYGRSPDQIIDDLSALVGGVILPMLAVLQEDGPDDMEKAVERLEGSAFNAAFRERSQHYLNLISRETHDIESAVFSGFLTPVAFSADAAKRHPVDATQWTKTGTTACTPESLKKLLRDIESAMHVSLEGMFGLGA